MMQQKNEPNTAKNGQKKPVTNDLRKSFGNLSQNDQVAVTTFFNLHNAAIFVYDNLSHEAQEYCEYCIKLSQEKLKN